MPILIPDPDYKEKRSWPPFKDGEYYSTATLMAALRDGVSFDCNRRQIRRWPESEVLMTFNDAFEEWTPEMEAELQAALDKLNSGAIPPEE